MRLVDSAPALIASGTETSLLETYSRDISSACDPASAFSVAAQCLRQLSAATVFALFRYDREQDQLVCEQVFGDKQGLLRGLTMPVGSRVSGWCAATGRISINATASLDLPNIADFFDPPLRSVFCIPIQDGDQVVNILSAYSPKLDAFNESHTYPFEQVATSLSSRLKNIPVVDTSLPLVFRARRR